MHKNIFPLFITSLGIITAYVFYAVWHIEEPMLNNPTIQTSKETSQTESIKSIASKDTTLKTIPSLAAPQNKTTNKEEPSVSSIVSQTPEEIQESYEALIPENYDDTVIEAQEAFASLDDAVLGIQEHLDTQMVETEQAE